MRAPGARRGAPLLFLVFFFIVGLCCSLFASDEIQKYGKVPDFSFMDQNGNTITNSDLQGLWVANFIFTRCQGMCPMLTGKMAALQEKFKDVNIKLVSFSVDPEFDTSRVLSQYAANYRATPGKWFFLTVNQRQMMWDFIMSGFMLGVGEPTQEDIAQGAEPVMHSSRFVLASGNNIIGYYDSNEPEEMEELFQNVLNLESSLRGSKQSKAEAISDLGLLRRTDRSAPENEAAVRRSNNRRRPSASSQ